MREKLLVNTLKLLPKNYLSWFFGKISSIHLPPPVNKIVIEKFAEFYKINLSEIDQPIESFSSLQEFFTRSLKNGARPIDKLEKSIVSPADGLISQCGKIDGYTLMQVKGKYYTLDKLLKDSEYIDVFKDGYFVTIYLSPKDYHRVHFPVNGKVSSVRYIKGKLFPVNTFSIAHFDELFTVNERVITYLEDKSYGTCGVVMVGATNVGAISLNFTDLITNKLGVYPQNRTFKDIKADKGDQLGCFHLGSTVILLFQKDKVSLNSIEKNKIVHMGEKIGEIS